MLKDSEFEYKSLNEGRKVIGSYFRGRYDEDLRLRVEKELVCHESTCDVGLTHSTKSFNDKPFGAILEVFTNIVLYWGWLRKSEVLPAYLEEYPEVFNVRRGCSTHDRWFATR